MTAAVEKAHEAADPSKDILKIFIAPEFFWRGKGEHGKHCTVHSSEIEDFIRLMHTLPFKKANEVCPQCTV